MGFLGKLNRSGSYKGINLVNEGGYGENVGKPWCTAASARKYQLLVKYDFNPLPLHVPSTWPRNTSIHGAALGGHCETVKQPTEVVPC